MLIDADSLAVAYGAWWEQRSTRLPFVRCIMCPRTATTNIHTYNGIRSYIQFIEEESTPVYIVYTYICSICITYSYRIKALAGDDTAAGEQGREDIAHNTSDMKQWHL